ncbi:MAG: hypothetical protein IJS51_11160 [Treponema sp.]|nr:hypothetical protein [Treponema sp.]
MEIEGSFIIAGGCVTDAYGAFEQMAAVQYINGSAPHGICGAKFKASKSWTGNTSEPSVKKTQSNDTNSNENRPPNYTYRIWKRTA